MPPTNNRTPNVLHAAATTASSPTEFEIRRAELVGEIGESLEQVLAQINTLNRSLEGIIEIGNEFGSVEALWSQFENFMDQGVGGDNRGGERDGQKNNNAQEDDVRAQERIRRGVGS